MGEATFLLDILSRVLVETYLPRILVVEVSRGAIAKLRLADNDILGPSGRARP